MRVVDVLLALPGILFAMALIAVLGRSQTAALVAVGITGIPSFARVTRAQVLSPAQARFRHRGRGLRRLVRPTACSAPCCPTPGARSSSRWWCSPRSRSCSRRRSPSSASASRRRRRAGARCCAPASVPHEAPTYAVLPGLVLTLTILSLRHHRPRARRACSRTATRRGDARQLEGGAAMIGYVARRLLQLLPVLLIASLGIWAMIYAVPGGPVGDDRRRERHAGADRRPRPSSFGLDRPVLVQYVDVARRARSPAISASRSTAASRCST